MPCPPGKRLFAAPEPFLHRKETFPPVKEPATGGTGYATPRAEVQARLGNLVQASGTVRLPDRLLLQADVTLVGQAAL